MCLLPLCLPDVLETLPLGNSHPLSLHDTTQQPLRWSQVLERGLSRLGNIGFHVPRVIQLQRILAADAMHDCARSADRAAVHTPVTGGLRFVANRPIDDLILVSQAERLMLTLTMASLQMMMRLIPLTVLEVQ